MSDSFDSEDLLAFALFDVDKRARQLQEPLYVFLISIVLLDKSLPVSRTELRDLVAGQLHHHDHAFSQNEFDQIVKAMVDAGLVEKAGDGKVALTIARRDQLTQAKNRLAQSRDAFQLHIRRSVEETLHSALTDEEAVLLLDAVEEHIHTLFQSRSVYLAQAFGPAGSGFDDAPETVQGTSCLRVGNVVAPSSKTRAAQIAKGLRDGLLNVAHEGRRYLAAEYQKTVASALLRQDPSVRRIKRQLGSRRVAYLDTNVLIAYLFDEHPNHVLAREVVELANRTESKLIVSKATVDELTARLNESDRKFKRLGRAGAILGVVNDDVLRTFQTARSRNPGLQWTAFFAERFPPDVALLENGIEIESRFHAEAIHDERMEKVRAAVRKTKPSPVSERVVAADAINLVIVQLARNQLHADELGNRVWLVTLDRTLRKNDRNLLKNGAFVSPSSMQASDWCGLLSSMIAPDNGTLENYVTHLVQSELGVLAEDPVFVDTDFLITLHEAKVDIDSLISGDVDKTRRVLIELEKEREIRELLERKNSGEPYGDEFGRELGRVVQKAVERITAHGEAETKLEKASAELEVLKHKAELERREKNQVKRELADVRRRLEKAVDDQQNPASDTLFSRLKLIFSRQRRSS